MYRMSETPLITASQIENRLDSLAQEIKAYGPDIILSALTGSFMFSADLSRRLATPELQIKFIRASSYGNSTESCGKVKIEGIENLDIREKKILVIDDILDTGCTMQGIRCALESLGANEIRICVLLDKAERRIADIHADYVGFDIENKFVVGYGLDYADNFRTFPDIWTLSEENA